MNETTDKVLAELRNAATTLGEARAFIHVAGYSFGLGASGSALGIPPCAKWLLDAAFDRIERTIEELRRLLIAR